MSMAHAGLIDIDDGSPASIIFGHPHFSLSHRLSDSNYELRSTKLQVLPFLIFKEQEVKSEGISTHRYQSGTPLYLPRHQFGLRTESGGAGK